MRIFIVSFVIGPLVAYVLWKLHARRARNIFTVQNKFGNPAACKEILACNGYGSSGTNTISAVESRAGPNQRLVKAFNIHNAFTTTDDQYRKSFTSKAASKMSALNEGDWKRIADRAEKLVQRDLGGEQ